MSIKKWSGYIQTICIKLSDYFFNCLENTFCLEWFYDEVFGS